MKKNLKNLIFLLCFTLLGGGISFSFNPEPSQISSLRSGAILHYHAPTAIDPLWQKERIVQEFCNQSLSPELISIFSDQDNIYSSYQSLFLSLLCHKFSNNFHESIDLNSEKNILKKEIGFKLLKYPEKCRDKYEENCNLAYLSELLISDIIADLTTLKQANLYGVMDYNFTNSEKLNYSISLFAEQKLNIGNAQDQETNFCKGTKHAYPQTCKTLVKNLKTFEKAFNQLKIIDAKKLLENSETKHNNQNFCNKQNVKTFNAIFCNIFGTLENDKGIQPFINQVYNELLRYQLFSAYYQYNLKIKSDPTTETLTELQILNTTPTQLLNITNTTLKELSDLLSVYPIHVGFLSYQEDLLWLRNNYLTKIITPFYTLFHKLQNVQVQK